MSAPPPVCVICDARAAHRPAVCEGCRAWLDELLADLGIAWSQLTAEPGSRATSRITGTGEIALGVTVAALDQMLTPPVIDAITDAYGDQVGHVPVAVVLASWVGDWLDREPVWRDKPLFTVDSMLGWLREYLDWACDRHPAIGAFATEIRTSLGACRAAIGDIPARPQLCVGVSCAHCGHRALYRQAGRISCAVCQVILTENEYADRVSVLAKSAETLTD